MADDKTKEIMEQLENGIKETLNSESYKAFLKVQSQFHSYSFNNAMLIYLQKPNATMVNGFKSWQNLGRYVMKGEKGISILAPNPYKYEKMVDVKDPKTGELKQDKVEMQGMSFRRVSVFDVSQTDGKELPSICNELQGNSKSAENIIKAIKEISDVPIIEKAIDSGAKGYYSRLENVIAIKEGMSLDQTAKTLIHEYAHSQLHNTEAMATLDRATKEVQAESVAYVVSNRFGVDTSDYSFEYLANWSSGKELPELKESFDLIQKTANKMIKEIESVLTHEMQLDNSPVKIVIQWSESGKLEKGQVLDVHEANELFAKLDKEQSDLRTPNQEIDFTKVTAGEKTDYIPYLKTKFEVILSDGRTSEARFDFGESGYKDLYECIKKECGIDVKDYLEKNALSTSKFVELSPGEIKSHVVAQYSKEFPAIKNISEKSATIIDNMNKGRDIPFTVKEIKQAYKDTGKRLETNNDISDLNEFKNLQDVVDDFKKAQLTDKQLKAQEKALSNQSTKSISPDVG